MSFPAGAGSAVDESAESRSRRGWRAVAAAGTASERRLAVLLAGALIVLGAPLGVLWEWISPPGPLGVRLPAGIEADETEAFVQSDGRFAAIVLVVGILAGVTAWLLKPARGILLAVALAVGTVGGSLLMDLVGYLLRGSGPTVERNGLTYYRHLPLDVHMSGLLLVEGTVALFLYAVFVAFAVRDDLGRPEGATPGVVGDQLVFGPPGAAVPRASSGGTGAEDV